MSKGWLAGVLAIGGWVQNPVLAQDGYGLPGADPAPWSINAPPAGPDSSTLYGGYPYEAPMFNERSIGTDRNTQPVVPGRYAPLPGRDEMYRAYGGADPYGDSPRPARPPNHPETVPPDDGAEAGDRPVFRPFDWGYLRFMRESVAHTYRGAWHERPTMPYPGQPVYGAPRYVMPEEAYPAYPMTGDYTAYPGGYPSAPGYWPVPGYDLPATSYGYGDEYVPPPPPDGTVNYGEFAAEHGYGAWPMWQPGYADEPVVPPPSEVPPPESGVPTGPAADRWPPISPTMPPFPDRRPYVLPPVTELTARPSMPVVNESMLTEPVLPSADTGSTSTPPQTGE